MDTQPLAVPPSAGRPKPSPPRADGLRRRLLALSALTCLLSAAPRASADPRWFWNDRPVGSLGPVSDVDIAVVAEPGLPLVIFVAWVEPPQFFEGALRLTASFDGGCSFCPPVYLESLFGPDDDIALAAAPQLRSLLPAAAFAVIHSSRGRVQVLHDSLSVPLTPGVDGCRAIQDLSLTVGRTELTAADGDHPDIAAVLDPPMGLPHFHAVWRQVAPTDETQVLHARDVSIDGSSWTVLPPLPGWPPPGQSLADPHVSLDLRTTSGVAVNVVYSVPGSNSVLSLRSVDSGDTFSATGEPPEGAPAVVAQAGLGVSGPLALDSGSSSDPSDVPWHGVLFFQDVGPAQRLVLDAQHQRAPTVPDPVWGPDQNVSPFGALRDQGLAVSVLAGGAAGLPQPTWLFWTMPSGTGDPAEVGVRGAVLDSDAAIPVDVDAPAFPPVRPGDPTISTAGPLTHCQLDPATGDCVPDRRTGGASHPASADGFGDAFVSWVDGREGFEAVYFKRTDRSVEPPRPTLEASCLSLTERRVTVTFDQLPRCSSSPAAAERLMRYLVYYGTDPAGPYENTDLDGTDPGVPDTIVVVDDGSLVDPVTVDIDGLAAGTTYHVIVVPEDEARNVFPPDFDPLADGASSPANEAAVATPVDCGACPPFDWGASVTAVPGDCTVELSWPAASGADPVVYDVLRDGAPVATGLGDLFWTDLDVTWGMTHAYAVRARDACPDPGPREETTAPTAPLGPDDATPPAVGAPSLTVVAACTVRVDASVDDACSGVTGLVDLWRDGVPVATDVTLPHDDVVPADAVYEYVVHALDRAGNLGVSGPESVTVGGCTPMGPCLFRATAAAADLASLRALVVTPRAPNDVAFAAPNDVPYGPCPFASGDADPEPVLDPGAPRLVLYQVEGAGIDLRVAKDDSVRSVRLSF